MKGMKFLKCCDYHTMMEWNRLAGTGVATAQKIVQRPTPFLTRHSASRLGGVTPMNNLPHDHVHTDLGLVA